MRLRLVLLAGQAVCLGLTSSLLIVAATSVFLSEYGAGALPYAYITVAVAGVAVSSAMTRAQRRLTLAGLAVTVLSVVAAMLAAGWAALALAGQTWVTFPLVVLIFLWIPVGFVLIGAQSGRLLDVQQLKSYFPRVAAGFSAGFAVGGLGAARLVSLLGSPDDLLVVDALIALVFLGLVVTTARRHPAELRQPPAPATVGAGPVARASLRSLLSNRLVVVLLGYQLLSAAGTQLLDYLVWREATARYPDPADLARFLGFFGAIINVVGLLFVFTLAGLLLARYGVRLGLAANPAGVLLLVVASTAVALAGGQGTTLFFVLVCAQQVVDIALTDGTTRGSINAAYQALPPVERFAAQTRVEGVGVPMAIGCVGVLLLVFNWLHAGVIALLIVALVVTCAWLGLAVGAYRLYGTNLRRTLTRRAWDPVALRLDDEASRAVVDRLLGSDDPRDVAVAVDALAAAAPEGVLPHVESLLRSEDPLRRRVGVDAARRHRVVGAGGALLATARDTAAPVELRARATRAAASLGASPDDLLPLVSDGSADVRASAAVALLYVRASTEDAEEVRRMLLEHGTSEAQAALVALADLPHELATRPLLELAALPQPPSALTDALASHAALLLPAARDALVDGAPRRYTERLVRAVAQVPDRAAELILLDHVDHPDRSTRGTVLRALSSRGRTIDDGGGRLRAALMDETSRTAHALDALDVLGHEPGAEDLCRALRDEVRDSAVRCSALIGLIHGPGLLTKAVAALGGDGRPLALETLEVTLGRSDEQLVRAVLDPNLTETDRRAALSPGVPTERRDAEEWLQEIALDPSGRWQEPWLRASALWALTRTGSPEWAPVAARGVTDGDPVVAETARAVLAR